MSLLYLEYPMVCKYCPFTCMARRDMDAHMIEKHPEHVQKFRRKRKRYRDGK